MSYRIFLDTADVSQIRDAVSTGIVAGIATNPNKMARAGRRYEDVVAEIRTFFDGPIAVEAISTETDAIVAEALQLSNMAKNLAIKIPATKQGIAAISRLVPQGVTTNATLIFNPGQALAAGLAGSPFISPFIGRAQRYGADGLAIFRDIRRVYDALGIKTCVIAASIRQVRDAIDAVIAGADSLALTYEVFCQLFEHPLTDWGIEAFARDYRSIYSD
ncbi:MAG: fructose-6-phosphate aldolase [Clostridiales bacterium]|nr:fructose-6-phosphate aldolase [Clostridiales bacterium]